MESKSIVPGREYALREPPRPGSPIQRVKPLERVRGGKWRVQWIDPNPGLVDFARSANFVVPWSDTRRLLRDEENHARLLEYSVRTWPGKEHPVEDAVNLVFEATGEDLCCWKSGGILSAAPDAIERVKSRAGGIDIESTVPEPRCLSCPAYGGRGARSVPNLA